MDPRKWSVHYYFVSPSPASHFFPFRSPSQKKIPKLVSTPFIVSPFVAGRELVENSPFEHIPEISCFAVQRFRYLLIHTHLYMYMKTWNILKAYDFDTPTQSDSWREKTLYHMRLFPWFSFYPLFFPCIPPHTPMHSFSQLLFFYTFLSFSIHKSNRFLAHTQKHDFWLFFILFFSAFIFF